MENSTVSFYFNLTMFVNIGHYRYPAFVFCFLLYSFIVYANLVIILVVPQETPLHEPMYMFIAMLCINSLYGSTVFSPDSTLIFFLILICSHVLLVSLRFMLFTHVSAMKWPFWALLHTIDVLLSVILYTITARWSPKRLQSWHCGLGFFQLLVL